MQSRVPAGCAGVRIGIDIGGTFTDLVLLAEGRIETHKVPSTPWAPSAAVVRGVRELLERCGADACAVGEVVHGTTLALNTVIERTGARVGLLVTRGNRDVLEIGRLLKPDKFNLEAELPPRLVPRSLVREVEERTTGGGGVLTAVRPEQVREVVQELQAAGAESFAVCLLHAYANPTGEETVGAAVAEVCPGLHRSLSSALWPEIREYERATVTCLNAYVQPRMDAYLSRVQAELGAAGLNCPLFITQSNGGMMAAETARATPVHTLLSGPAGGVVGAAHVARAVHVMDAITLDIGGTSADVAIIRDGVPLHSTESQVGGLPCVLPSVDVFSIGAGGGSVAWLDPLGVLKVGPRSAGADPGPASYGRGGAEPTVTDAYVVCGYLNPDNFLGGSMRLDAGRAVAALEPLARQLARGIPETAEAVLSLATSLMSSALRPLLAKRGIDPRDFALMVYGGAGPTHGCLLAEDMPVRAILVPPSPGTLCALGAGLMATQADFVRTVKRDLHELTPADLAAVYGELERGARAWVAGQRTAAGADSTVAPAANMRYVGQAFDLEVPLPPVTPALPMSEVAACFHRAYEERYRYCDPEAPVELVNARLRIRAAGPDVALPAVPWADGAAEPSAVGARRVFRGGRWHEAAVYDRSGLRLGHVLPGPAIVEQYDTTTVVPPGFTARVVDHGVLAVERRG